MRPVKAFQVYLCSFALICAQSAHADTTESQFLKQVLQSQSLLSSIETDITAALNTIPTGLNNTDISPDCDPHRFEESVIDQPTSTPQYYARLQEFYSRCGDELSDKGATGMKSLLNYSFYEYDFFSHPLVKKYSVTLPNGIQVPGILAMKQDPRPRPMVIIRCGTFCAAEESPSTISFLMHFYDQAPFNVFLMASTTGEDYIRQNGYVSIGGWNEGYEALQVGMWLKESWEFKDRISSLHFAGLSLGGNAAVLGASFNDMYPLPDGSKVFNSVMALCPVVNLEPTLQHLFADPIMGRVFYSEASGEFLDMKPYVNIPELLSKDLIPQRAGMTDYIGVLNVESMQKRGVAMTEDSYFASNNFFNLTTPVTTPMLAMAAKDDAVVVNKLNALALSQDNMYQNSSTLSVLNMEYGNHCAFSAAYGTEFIGTVLRTFVLSHSPEYSNYQRQQTHWKYGFMNFGDLYTHVGQIWQFKKGSNKAQVTFRLFNWKLNECFDEGPWTGDPRCILTKTQAVPISDIQSMGAHIPVNDVDAQVLSREFNSQVEFRTTSGPLTGTSSHDFYMAWRPSFE